MDPKEAAAVKALELVEDGMILGLGTGTTAVHFINALGSRIRERRWHVRGVPTSERSRRQAEDRGISLVDLADVRKIDLAIDGADEADPNLNLIKGGGGALLREKLVAAAARELIVVGDSGKFKETLGAFPLPIAIVPFGWTATAARLERLGAEPRLRLDLETGRGPYVTDDGLYILDMEFGCIEDVAQLEREIKLVPGVVEVGLFVGMASRLILGYDDGHTKEILARR